MAGKRRELPARPYDRWDVWANRTYFNTTRCSINDKKFDGGGFLVRRPEKNDREYKCTSCPAVRTSKADGYNRKKKKKVKRGCRTMFEGRASHYRGTGWIGLFLLVALLFVVSSFASYFLYGIMLGRLYNKAFAEWRQRGIVTRVEFITLHCSEQSNGPRGGYVIDPTRNRYLRLFFPPTQQGNVADTRDGARDDIAVPVATMAASTFTVQVPPDGSAGQVMQLQAPNGVMLQVQIPFGCAAGSTFEVAMPARA